MPLANGFRNVSSFFPNRLPSLRGWYDQDVSRLVHRPSYLFPPSPHDWLPEGDLVYFLLDTVATLDLSPLFAHYERELRGQPPFHPRLMVALLLYCYATGTRSSRRIMRRCHVDVLPRHRGKRHPRFPHHQRLPQDPPGTTRNPLRRGPQALRPWPAWPRSAPSWLDGTRIKANASRHKAMSYDRMKSEEIRLKGRRSPSSWPTPRPPIRPRDFAPGPDRHGDELPDELARRRAAWRRSNRPRNCWRNC